VLSPSFGIDNISCLWERVWTQKKLSAPAVTYSHRFSVLSSRRKAGKVSFWNQFPVFDYSLPIAKKTLVLSVLFVGMITFNNVCLQYVEVSFYNVARSLTIVFNVVFTYFILSETTSLMTCSTLLIVVLGFVVSAWRVSGCCRLVCLTPNLCSQLGTEGEVNFSLIGTLFGVASSAFVSLNAIFTKSCLAVVDSASPSLCLCVCVRIVALIQLR
jgi:drug/metabolite transporter (DMT)-like permease